MSVTTYEQFASIDPTQSFLFKAALVLERAVAAMRIRVLIEVARLVMLGFYDDFRTFVDMVERVESQSRTEAQYTAIWSSKVKASENTEKLIHHLEALASFTYRGRNLVDYVMGADRLQHMKLFVEMVRVERQGEEILGRARKDFLAAFARHKLTNSQRTALLLKYKEMSEAAVATPHSAQSTRP